MADFNGTYFYEATRRTRKHGERRGVVRRQPDIRLRHRLLPPRERHPLDDLSRVLIDAGAAFANLWPTVEQAADGLVEFFAQMDRLSWPVDLRQPTEGDKLLATALPIPRNSRADQTAAFRAEHGFED